MTFGKHSGSSRDRSVTILFVFAISMIMSPRGAFASGAREKVIYSFQGGSDGAIPQAPLIADKAGDLFGTTVSGGASNSCSNCGTVFELSPPATAGGIWTKTTLHRFQGGSQDGDTPSGRLVFDQAGNLFGTTFFGGSQVICYKFARTGCGTVYELSPPATQGGAWVEKVLFAFTPNSSGTAAPASNLVIDSAGNLYGTTEGVDLSCGVPGGCGVVFELSPPATPGDPWAETTLFDFGNGRNGSSPSNLVFDRPGAIYGITGSLGGCCGAGTVFKMHQRQGVWSLQTLFIFKALSTGEFPTSLTLDGTGNLYGVAQGPTGPKYLSVIFELTPPASAGSHWSEATIYSFTGGKDGDAADGFVIDKAGNLYGTAFDGGLKNSRTHDNGTVFRLSPPAVSGDPWTETTLHEFGGSYYNDGSGPFGRLVLLKGTLYGTTTAGGSAGAGTVFSTVVE